MIFPIHSVSAQKMTGEEKWHRMKKYIKMRLMEKKHPWDDRPTMEDLIKMILENSK